MFDSKELEVLDPSECLRLLRGVSIGRIVFIAKALPAVHPVRFVFDGDSVLFRTTNGTKFAAAERKDIVAFEVDDIDAAGGRGWSVTLVGHAESVTDAAELQRLEALELPAWAPEDDSHFVRIWVEVIQGRRLIPRAPRARVADDEPSQPAYVHAGDHADSREAGGSPAPLPGSLLGVPRHLAT